MTKWYSLMWYPPINENDSLHLEVQFNHPVLQKKTIDCADWTDKKSELVVKMVRLFWVQRCTNSRMVNMSLYQMDYFPNVFQFLHINCLESFPFDREIFYSDHLVLVLILEHEEIDIFHWKLHFQTFSFPIILKSIWENIRVNWSG